jgi:hypothetical protein
MAGVHRCDKKDDKDKKDNDDKENKDNKDNENGPQVIAKGLVVLGVFGVLAVLVSRAGLTL